MRKSYLLGCDFKFQFPFGEVEVSEEFICSDPSTIDLSKSTSRLTVLLGHMVPTASSVSTALAWLPDGVRPCRPASSFDGLCRNIVSDLACILSTRISSMCCTTL